jgi:hypothetical protein
MDETVLTTSPVGGSPSVQDAWQFVLGQLQGEMSRAMYETWVRPLRPLGYQQQVMTIGAYNSYARDWVDNRLRSRITKLLEGAFNEPVQVRILVTNSYLPAASLEPARIVRAKDKSASEEKVTAEGTGTPASSRKMMLQRAYGSERAKLIQPERGLFVTLYLFYEWLPLIGHSAFATVLAARSLCYWNPMTGELRNTVDTEMSELAERADVSVRTVKDVLSQELVRTYFLRYRVRRMMTPNGVRTAGISLQVRMDDPLTPNDQELSGCSESLTWYSPNFEDENEGDAAQV